MNWSNVKLILVREVRDQLRDRRTLFMIAVLPMLLYPLLGMSLFKISQFISEKPTTVLVVGAADLEGLPPLVKNGCFVSSLFGDPKKADLLPLRFPRVESDDALRRSELREQACQAVQAGEYDAALYFPGDFGARARAFQQAIREFRQKNGDGPHDESAPELDVHPEIIYSTANEKSQIAFARLSEVWRRWNERIGRTNLTARGLPANAANPFEVTTVNLAIETGRHGTALWSKVLPVLLLLWAMTGAFYPAVDLCAGEKERGTLETLLCSPAERSEIVLGKLLTIMLFSMATAVLNLVSLGMTGWFVMARLPELGPPPPESAFWLLIALGPVSALFSALCLALAAFARSTKEGQYYLVPLLLVTMPLVVLPMSPGVELNLGTSLIPVTGVVLLLRSMLEGAYWQAFQFAAPVVAVTLACCLLAIRWAIEQFNSESVLFRESERLDVGLRLRHLLADRRPTPTVATALACVLVILVAQFFIGLLLPNPSTFGAFALVISLSMAVIVVPPLVMTLVLTSSPRQTLLLKRPRWSTVAAAAALAVALHPLVPLLARVVQGLYPIDAQLAETFSNFVTIAPSTWHLLFLVAFLPAVCEEIAFRGFILSGFRHLGHKWRAIIYTALLFGFAHTILQQSIATFIVGIVLGYLAVQSESLLTVIVFHFTHNALSATGHRIAQAASEQWPRWSQRLVEVNGTDISYHLPVVLAGAAAAVALLAWFHRLPYTRSAEEERQDAIRTAGRVAG